MFKFLFIVFLSIKLFSITPLDIDNRSDINDIVLDSSGKYIFSVSDDGKLREWDLNTTMVKSSIRLGDDILSAIAISPNGRYIIVGSSRGDIKLLDSSSLKILNSFNSHSSRINRLIFSKNSRDFFIAFDDGIIEMRDLNSSKPLKEFNIGANFKIKDMVLSSDEKYILFATASSVAKLLNIKSGLIVKSFQSGKDRLLCVALSYNSKYFAMGFEDGLLEVRSFKSGKPLKSIKRAHLSAINSLIFSLDDRFIISASGSFYGKKDNSIKIWSLKNGKRVVLYKTLRGHRDYINRIILSKDGRYIISASDDETIRVWDFKSGKLIKVLQGQKSFVNSIDISANGRYLLSGSDDATIRLWDTKRMKLSREYRGDSDPILSVSFSGNEKYIVAGSGAIFGDLSYSISLYKRREKKPFKRFKSTRYIDDIDVSQGRYIVASLQDSYDVKLWDRKRGTFIRSFVGHIGQIRGVAISSMGSYIVSGSDDTTVKLWSRSQGRLIHTFKGHSDSVVDVAISNNNKYIVSASKDKTIKVWSRKKKTLLTSIDTNLSIDALAISNRAKYIVVASNSLDENSTIEVWDREKKRLVKRFFDNSRDIRDIAIDRAGRYVYSASGYSIRVWDIKSKRKTPIKEFVGGANGNWIVFDYLKNREYQRNSGSFY